MIIPAKYREILDTACDEGVHCLVGTISPEGRPQISPKGSLRVYDEGTLAFWERSRRSTFVNIQSNPFVTVYLHHRGRADELPLAAVLRLHGKATAHEDGPVRDAVMARVIKTELDKDPERKGIAILIEVDSVTDLPGNELGES